MKTLSAKEAQDLIRETAKDSGNVILGSHARRRMNERSIDSPDVMRILCNGYVDDLPIKNEHGEWQCKVTLKLRGQRTAGAITIILLDERLFIKTVEWEDE